MSITRFVGYLLIIHKFSATFGAIDFNFIQFVILRVKYFNFQESPDSVIIDIYR